MPAPKPSSSDPLTGGRVDIGLPHPTDPQYLPQAVILVNFLLIAATKAERLIAGNVRGDLPEGVAELEAAADLYLLERQPELLAELQTPENVGRIGGGVSLGYVGVATGLHLVTFAAALLFNKRLTMTLLKFARTIPAALRGEELTRQRYEESAKSLGGRRREYCRAASRFWRPWKRWRHSPSWKMTTALLSKVQDDTLT